LHHHHHPHLYPYNLKNIALTIFIYIYIMASSEPRDDIQELFDKCKNLSERDPSFILRLATCRVSLEEVQQVVEAMGRALINVGDGLTLLLLAAQFGREDIAFYLAGEKEHPLEVRDITT
jgi:hypothetical protein